MGGAIGINWHWASDQGMIWITTTMETSQYNMINIFVRCSSLLVIGCCSLNTVSSPGCYTKTLKSWTKTSLGPWTVSRSTYTPSRPWGWRSELPPCLMAILSRSGKQWWKVHEGTVSGDNVHSHWFLAISCFSCAFFLVCTKYIQILWLSMTQMMKNTTAPQSVAQRKLATAIRSRGDQPQCCCDIFTFLCRMTPATSSPT